jgi:hypothetical protein
MSYKNNVTYIDELPDIEELEQQKGLSMVPEAGKFQKFLRNNNYNPVQQSGMNTNTIPTYDPYKTGYHNVNQGSYIDSFNNPRMLGHSSGGLAPNNQQFYESYEGPPMKSNTSCLDVAEHATNCPVCSKLYNNDKTIFIIIIAILSIIIILLLKRVLNV